MSVALRHPQAYADVDVSSPVLPAAHLVGVVRGVTAGASPVLAVAVNGTVAAVTRAEPGGGGQREFSAMIPPRLLRDGRNDVAVLLVGPGRRLTPSPSPTAGTHLKGRGACVQRLPSGDSPGADRAGRPPSRPCGGC